MTGKTFDPLCYELAEHFLADELKAGLRSAIAKTHLARRLFHLDLTPGKLLVGYLDKLLGCVWDHLKPKLGQ